jgi:membrane protein implicated in regulation of membrane protease activity
MKMLAILFSHSSIQFRILSLGTSGIVFTLGLLLGFLSWMGLIVGAFLGLLLGVFFWYETKDPLYRDRQFPVTTTQKIGHCALFVLYAVFIGCIVEWTLDTGSPAWTVEVLALSLDGLIGFTAAFTLAQLVRLWHYLLQGGVLDRFIWRERQTGREGMLNRVGIVKERLAPEGKIFIRGEWWDAEVEGDQPVEAGGRVITRRMVGLKLVVEPCADGVRLNPNGEVRSDLHGPGETH